MFCRNCGKKVNQLDERCSGCGIKLHNIDNPYANNREGKSKIAAGLLGIFLGALGIHNFYLGFTKRATIQLVITIVGGLITCGLAAVAVEIWGLIEGIMILAGKVTEDANGVPLVD